jgi:hypothetical protein
LKFLASNLNTVLPIIITFPFDLFDGPFRPLMGLFDLFQKNSTEFDPFLAGLVKMSKSLVRVINTTKRCHETIKN